MRGQKIGIIIQARSGSTRMPRKILSQFNDGQSLLHKVVEQVSKNSFGLPIIVATTTSPSDNSIMELDLGPKVGFFRGSEHNVLSRFIDCCDRYTLDKCIRVCSDNPFLNPSLIDELIEVSISNPEVDYLSHSVNGTPGIKMHLGVFTELISLRALKHIQKVTDDSYYLEHVTNYLYENTPEELEIQLIPKDNLSEYSSLRLTIDTLKDFETCGKIIEHLDETEQDYSLSNIKSFIDSHLGTKTMKEQIKLNRK